VRAAQLLPFLVLPLALGVLVERRPQRRLMVQADLGRGLVLLLVAGLALTGALTVPSLSPLSPSSVPALSSTAWPTSPTFHGC
jgi:hypothetical protein